MQYKVLEKKNDKNFKRTVGIPRALFEILVAVLNLFLKKNKVRRL